VQNSDTLKIPPILVSITNFPPSARPQAGLSYSPIVFEIWIGEGMTRFLSVFYGDFPPAVQEENQDANSLTEGIQEPVIGPIRSGRLPYEHIRKLFNGLLVMDSAYKDVADRLSNYSNIYGSDDANPNSAMLGITQLEKIAETGQMELGEPTLSGQVFEGETPEGGSKAQSLWLFYSYLNQIFWRYDKISRTYHRYQDNADGSTFIQATDRLNGEPLAFSNVIVLFADHKVERKYMIDIDLMYIKREKALLFRDGKMYEIYWTTASEEYEKTTGRLRPIRFIDAQGNPFPLKPGQTWIEIVPILTHYWETIDSEIFNRLAGNEEPGSGFWAVRVYAPK